MYLCVCLSTRSVCGCVYLSYVSVLLAISRRIAGGGFLVARKPPQHMNWGRSSLSIVLYVYTVMRTVGNLHNMMRHYALYSQKASHVLFHFQLVAPDALYYACRWS